MANKTQLEMDFRAAKADYDKAKLAERRHQGSAAETDYCDRKMQAALDLLMDSQEAM